MPLLLEDLLDLPHRRWGPLGGAPSRAEIGVAGVRVTTSSLFQLRIFRLVTDEPAWNAIASTARRVHCASVPGRRKPTSSSTASPRGCVGGGRVRLRTVVRVHGTGEPLRRRSPRGTDRSAGAGRRRSLPRPPRGPGGGDLWRHALGTFPAPTRTCTRVSLSAVTCRLTLRTRPVCSTIRQLRSQRARWLWS